VLRDVTQTGTSVWDVKPAGTSIVGSDADRHVLWDVTQTGTSVAGSDADRYQCWARRRQV
jgi:hypothetical protein